MIWSLPSPLVHISVFMVNWCSRLRKPEAMFRRTHSSLAALLVGSSLTSGCIAATAIDVAASTVGAGVKVTGAVVGTGVDLVTTSKDEKKKKEKKAQD